MNDHDTFKGLSEQLETTRGASTRIFKQLNSKAIIGFDSITDMLRFRPLSLSSSFAELIVWQLCWLSSFSANDGPETFAGSTARTLHIPLIQESKQSMILV